MRGRLALAAVVVTATTAAHAQPAVPVGPAGPAADKEAGQAAFRVGAQAFRARQFDVAARSFEEAYLRDPRPETAFSIAQANRLQYYLDRVSWRVQRAVQLYQAYLDALPAGPRAPDAIARLAELEPILGELRRRGELRPYQPPVRTQLVVGAEVERAVVRIDGKATELWQPVDVSAGPHEIVVEAAGFAPARRRVVVPAGGFLPIDVALRALPGRLRVRTEAGAAVYVDGRRRAVAPHGDLAVAPGEHFVSVTRRGRQPWSRVVAVGRDQQLAVEAELAPTGQRRVARWVLASAGVVAAGAGGAGLWSYVAQRDADALDRKRRDLTATPADLERYNDRVADASRRRDLAIGLAVGAGAVALLGAGMYWFDHEPPGRAPDLELQPILGADQAGLALGAAF